MKTTRIFKPLEGHDPETAECLVALVDEIYDATALPFDEAQARLLALVLKENDTPKGVAKDPVRSAIVEDALHHLRTEHYMRRITEAHEPASLDKLNALFAEVSVNEDPIREKIIAAYERIVRALCNARRQMAEDIHARMATHSDFLAKPHLKAWVIKMHYAQYVN